MRTIISNKIEIENPTPDILAWCEESLVLDNPEFYKLQRLGKWTGRTPQEIVLYERKGDSVLLPFGCLQDVWSMIKDCEYKVEISPVRNVGYDTSINLYDYQKNAVENALKRKNGILVMPCGSGKGLPLDAKIYTPDGWVINGDLHVGDKVIGANGESTIVTGVFDKGVVDAYKITFSDNTEVICDKDHMWAIQKQWERTEKRPYRVMSTEDIFKHYKNITRSQLLYIPIVEPVKFKAKKVKMNPWLLGFLLGDGCFGNTITFSTSEKDILDKVKNTTMNTFRCRGGYDYAFRKGEIYNSIKEIGLLGLHSYEKYIPKIYKYNSINVRLSILQGLFDADGYTSNKGLYEYSTSSITLANDFVEIVESLGGTAKIKEKIPTYTYNGEKRKGRKSYRIFFKLYKFVPFTSKKHKSAYCKRTKYSQAYRIIKKIEKHKPIKSRCISVDAQDNLYVTNHFIVTHNTQVALDLITRVGGRALWLTHTQDLLNQSFNRAKSTIDAEGTFGKITAGKIDVGTAITFATIQTLSKIDLTDYKDYWDIIICDECFPKDTKISTPTGYKLLQDLQNDDIVLSFNRNLNRIEEKKVKSVFKLKAHDIARIKLENGEEVVATKNHPFYVKDKGWINAENLGGNDYVMRLVRKRVQRRRKSKNNTEQNKKTWLWILFQRMCHKGRSCKRCVDRRTQGNCIQNNETHKRKISRLLCRFSKKAQMDTRATRRNLKAIKGDRTSSQNKVWKWHGFNCSATKVDACFGRKIFGLCGISYSNKNEKRKWLSNLLQNRHCNSRKNDCNRSRWKFALCNRKKKTGRKENKVLKWIRVESVAFQKQTSDGTFGGLCPDSYVYNIEVEDNNNYFANGILVHNCQHTVGSPTKVTQFYKVLSNLTARYKIGLTATPKRADGLERAMFALLGNTIYTVTRDDVKDTTCPIKVQTIQTGYMPEYNAILLGDGTLNYNALVTDLIKNEERFNLVRDTVNSLIGGALVLANRIDYIQRLADADVGKAVCLSTMGQSKKAKAERKEVLRKLNDGEIDTVYATYQLAKEGLDAPNLRYVVFATPEKDETTVVQSVGRVGRKANGKDFGTVIDFVDSFGMYIGWSKKRQRYYKKLGVEEG